MKKIFFLTGEVSGDIHAASLLNELYKILPKEQLIVKAVGGIHLKNAGADIFFNSKHLASMGLTEVINKLPLYINLERELLFYLATFQPNVLVLVDFPGFNLRITSKIKKFSPKTKVVYYFPPQVWAWNTGRTKILAKHCDLVLCGLPFEETFHKKYGVNASYVGNPILHELEKFDRDEIRKELNLTKENTLISLFPGSRKSEIHYMLPVLLEAADMLHKAFANYKFMISQAPTISNLDSEIKAIVEKKNLSNVIKNITILPPGQNHKLLCASDFAWLTSGTVTLEAALYETPMILGYRGNQINYFLYLMLKKIDMIGLPNIIAEKKIVPELIQNDATAQNYYQTTKELLKVHGHLDKVKDSLRAVKEKITEKDASKEAALMIKNKFMPDYKVITMK